MEPPRTTSLEILEWTFPGAAKLPVSHDNSVRDVGDDAQKYREQRSPNCCSFDRILRFGCDIRLSVTRMCLSPNGSSNATDPCRSHCR